MSITDDLERELEAEFGGRPPIASWNVIPGAPPARATILFQGAPDDSIVVQPLHLVSPGLRGHDHIPINVAFSRTRVVRLAAGKRYELGERGRVRVPEGGKLYVNAAQIDTGRIELGHGAAIADGGGGGLTAVYGPAEYDVEVPAGETVYEPKLDPPDGATVALVTLDYPTFNGHGGNPLYMAFASGEFETRLLGDIQIPGSSSNAQWNKNEDGAWSFARSCPLDLGEGNITTLLFGNGGSHPYRAFGRFTVWYGTATEDSPRPEATAAHAAEAREKKDDGKKAPAEGQQARK